MHQLNQGLQMSLQTISQTFGDQVSLNSTIKGPARDRNWHAVYTVPQHEKSVVKHLDLREIESFLPVYETVRVWKNRQRMKLILPLFPTYLFVHINFRERARVLQSPGVLQIVGNRECAYIPDSEVEFLRSGLCRQRIEPYRDLVVGEKVRIKSGVMQGLQGTLVRKSNSMRFVLTVELINQHAAIQVDAEDLEQIVA
jgi:transcription antitermination factor NusG